MAIGSDTIALFEYLHFIGKWPSAGKIVELGDQDVDCLFYAPILSRFLDRVLGAPVSKEELERLCHTGGRDLYTRIGLDYLCVDLNGRKDALVLDLNTASVPEEHCGTAAAVTNLGTSEHVFHDANCFKVMHDFCAVDGLMLHSVPFLGQIRHGYYAYHPILFQELAMANGYELIGIWINPTADKQRQFLVPWTEEVMEWLTLGPTQTTQIWVAFRKTADQPFRLPYDGHYAESFPEEMRQNMSGFLDGLHREAPSYDAVLAALSGRRLLGELVARMLRKAKSTLRIPKL